MGSINPDFTELMDIAYPPSAEAGLKKTDSRFLEK